MSSSGQPPIMPSEMMHSALSDYPPLTTNSSGCDDTVSRLLMNSNTMFDIIQQVNTVSSQEEQTEDVEEHGVHDRILDDMAVELSRYELLRSL